MSRPASKEITIRPLTGLFDRQSPPDEVAMGNFRLVKNASVRGVKKRCRRGGWQRLFKDVAPYNNQDLHDQLVSLQYYYTGSDEWFTAGGQQVGWDYPGWIPPYTTQGGLIFTPNDEPVCGYYPDFLETYPFGWAGGGCYVDDFHEGFPYTITETTSDFPCVYTSWSSSGGECRGLKIDGTKFAYGELAYWTDCDGTPRSWSNNRTIHWVSCVQEGSAFQDSFPDPYSNAAITYLSACGSSGSGDATYYEGNYFFLTCVANAEPEYHEAAYAGPEFPLYAESSSYQMEVCGDELYDRLGCREAISHLKELVSASNGRRLIAGTRSRVYALNEVTGNWKILADGLGQQVYDVDCCKQVPNDYCCEIRLTSAVMGQFIAFTNNIDDPFFWIMGDDIGGCDLWAATKFPDLQDLDISRVGVWVAWKGFLLGMDITQGSEDYPGRVIWSDFEDPTSFVLSDNSLASFADVAPGETFLAAAPLGTYLFLFTDKSIYRVSMVGGDRTFSFERIEVGEDAIKYRHSLVATPNELVYLGARGIYTVNLYDQRPVKPEWINVAAPVIFEGIDEGDTTYGPINEIRCDQAVGGYNDQFKEVWFSWCSQDINPETGELFTCPNVSLVLNVQYPAADIVDHGFTAFCSYRSDDRPTFASWLQDLQVCSPDDILDWWLKEGLPYYTHSDFPDPPAYIKNATEDPDLPTDPNSLCALLEGRHTTEFCKDCVEPAKFVMASAYDFTLKEYVDDLYNREVYDDTTGEYALVGYQTAIRSGPQDFSQDNAKLIQRVFAEFDAVFQTTPNDLYCDLGYGNKASNLAWETLDTQPLKNYTDSELAALQSDNERPDDRASYPCFREGRFLQYQLRVEGTGGGACFGAVTQVVQISEFSHHA